VFDLYKILNSKKKDMSHKIANQFRKPSGWLGKIISRIMIIGNSSQYNKLIPELDIKQNDKILEIGYGHGLGINKISSNFDCFVSGIDFSELMYKQATKRNKIHIENRKAELLYGDFLSTELTSNYFDKVFCLNVIYFWDTLEEPFSKIYTVLKEGGILCMFMEHSVNLDKMKFTKNEIFNLYAIEYVADKLKLAGFSDITFKFDKGYIIKCKK